VSDVVFSLDSIVKDYGAVRALDNVSIEVRKHEVVGLVGENGAGKSTLLKVLSGNVRPDSGIITLRDQPVRLPSVADAMHHGIAMVHQEQSLLPNVSVAENVLLGNEGDSVRGGIYRWGRLRARAQRELDAIGSPVKASAPTESLSFARRQMVEVAKALATGLAAGGEPILLLDEPTSVLESQDIATLFEVVRRLREQASVVFVSHRLEEVLEICDRIYVMRDGAVVAERTPADADVSEIFRLMVGRDLTSTYFNEDRQQPCSQEVRFALEGASGRGFTDVDLVVHAGEVVSVMGVQESGREAMGRAIFGAQSFTAGRMVLDGKAVHFGAPSDAVRAGVGYVPSERKIDGALLGMTVAENMTLAHMGQVTTGGILNPRKQDTVVREWVEKLHIKTPSTQAYLRNLSGGNQQKVVLAKWLVDEKLRLLVLDTPTRGLDVGAKADLYALMRDLAASGLAVLLLADSLEEGIYMSHRVLTMKDGRVTGEFPSVTGARPSRAQVVERMV
jgi:ribose transport system ATP-binding protein